jgi:hypothetical protein
MNNNSICCQSSGGNYLISGIVAGPNGFMETLFENPGPTGSTGPTGPSSSGAAFGIPLGEYSYNNTDAASQFSITLTDAGTYYPINPVGTLTTNNSEFKQNYFDTPTAGTIRYVGASTGLFMCNISLSMSVSNASNSFSVVIIQNSSPVAGSYYGIDFPGNNRFHSVMIQKVLTLATNQTISLSISDLSANGKTIKVENLNITILSTRAIAV